MFNADLINKDYLFWRLFDYAHRVISLNVTNELHKRKLSPELINLLEMIYRAHLQLGYDPTPADLARISKRKPQTITAISKRAIEKGYIDKIKETKGNMYRLILTKKGWDTCQKVVGMPLYSKLFFPLTQNDHEQLEIILSKLTERTRINAAKKLNKDARLLVINNMRM
jgi:DNA-binding MarR family transcriptional regulator